MCLVVDIVANHVRPMTVQTDYTPTAIKTYLGPEGINPFNKTAARTWFSYPYCGCRRVSGKGVLCRCLYGGIGVSAGDSVHRRKFEALTSRLASWRSPPVLFRGEKSCGFLCWCRMLRGNPYPPVVTRLACLAVLT